MNRRFLPVILMFLATALLVGCSSSDTHEADASSTVKQTAGYPQAAAGGPTFEFTATDLEGNLHRSEEWIGKQPVVLNFWGTWCPPCRREIPDLVKVYNEFQDQGVAMLGLTILRRETPADVQSVADQYGMDWQMLIAKDNLLMKYQITGVPTTFFLDREGKIQQVFVGPRGYSEFKQAFQAIL